jgi:hypothetical protein
VTKEKAEAWCRQHNCIYFETSAKVSLYLLLSQTHLEIVVSNVLLLFYLTNDVTDWILVQTALNVEKAFRTAAEEVIKRQHVVPLKQYLK